KRLRLTQQRLDLPRSSEFARFVVEIASAGARQSRDCADFVRFLAFTGLRKTEVKYVAWEHIDFAQNEIIVVGDPITGTKSNQVRHVPMIPEVKTMLKTMRKQRS